MIITNTDKHVLVNQRTADNFRLVAFKNRKAENLISNFEFISEILEQQVLKISPLLTHQSSVRSFGQNALLIQKSQQAQGLGQEHFKDRLVVHEADFTVHIDALVFVFLLQKANEEFRRKIFSFLSFSSLSLFRFLLCDCLPRRPIFSKDLEIEAAVSLMTRHRPVSGAFPAVSLT